MKEHEIALWSGVAAFFASLLAIGVFDVLDPDNWLEYLSAILVALITSGCVYAKQRLDDAKRARLEDAHRKASQTRQSD
jgi:cyclopropane fatty-acyl-phospholipid synthase-like methyltransferase